MTADALIEHLANVGIRRLRLGDLLAEADFATYELAELAQKGDYESGYAQYTETRARTLSAELDRRAKLIQFKDDTAPSIPLDFIIKIKETVDIEDVFNRFLGIFCRPTSPTRSIYACPAHPDKHPSGVIYRDEGRYHCFQCQADGDCFDALIAFKGLTFMQAVDAIAGYVGLGIPQPKAKGPAKGCVAL